jgi:hypothetical protein
MLEDIKNKRRPFDVPQGYFSTLEDSVREKIHAPQRESNVFMSAVRTTFALAFSFLAIFGMGYGVMSLTRTMTYGDLDTEYDEFAILLENGYIKHDFIDYLYDEIDMIDISHLETLDMDEELFRRIELEMSEVELLDHIEKYHNE